MAKFRFIGNPRDPKDSRASITFGGIVFPLGEPVEVANEAVAAKLRGNSHFSEVQTRNREPKEEVVSLPSGAAEKAEVKNGR
jgi:hypothetical protein